MASERDILASHIDKNSLGHGYLFTGPGNETLAEDFIKSLLCLSPKSLSSCGECRPCKLFLKNPEFVIHIIDSAKGAGIDQVRKMRAAAFLTAPEKKNIFLVRFPERMSREASSAMLKILEEPPKGVIFVFLAENPFLIHHTLRSRMAIFRSNDEQSYAHDSLGGRIFREPLYKRFREANALTEKPEEARAFVRSCVLALERELRENVGGSGDTVSVGRRLEEATRALFLLEHSRVHPRLILDMFLSAGVRQG